MVGIGKLTLRQKEHLVAVRPIGDALVLELMRFEHELVEPEELSFPSTEQQNVRPQELEMAEQLIGNLAESFDPSKYRDEYEEKLQALLKAKLKGKKLPDDGDDENPEKTKVIDLVARLQESLASTKAKKPTAKSPTAKKKTTRAKSARKRRAS
jgi:DNA end-binding protein Ku